MRRSLYLCTLAALTGCAPYQVQKLFVHDASCPIERVQVARLLPAQPASVEPPPEVAADPSRLVIWRRDQQRPASQYSRRYTFVARGCGHEQRYDCLTRDGDGCGKWVGDRRPTTYELMPPPPR